MTKLLSLPGEIRNMIHRWVLAEPPLQVRHHNAFCEYCPHMPGTIPIPPVVLVQDKEDSILQVCPCAKRQGLALLRCCRRIYAEAGPIFWSENAFLFRSKHDFISCGINKMPADRRRWIADVMILSRTNSGRRRAIFDEEDGLGDMAASTTERLWEAILQCSGLRNLEMHPAYFNYQGATMRRIATCLPNLISLRACDLRFRAYSAPPNDNAGIPSYDVRTPAIFYIASLPMAWSPAGPDAGANWESHINAIQADVTLRVVVAQMITDEMGIPPGSAEALNTLYLGPSSDYPLLQVKKLISDPVQSLGSPPDSVRVHFLGLPLSGKELRDNRRRRELHTQLLKEGRQGLYDGNIHRQFWYEDTRTRCLDRLQWMAFVLVGPAARMYLMERIGPQMLQVRLLDALPTLFAGNIFLGLIFY